MVDKFFIHPGNAGSLINEDLAGLDAYRLARRRKKEQDDKINEINNIKEDVQSLKQDFSEIKFLLQALLERNK